MSGADLFVVCKSCGAEVSAYITECPYCGHRLRKRAPKLDRPGEPPKPSRRLRRAGRGERPRLGRLRRGEMPGIRFDRRPVATLTLVGVSVAASVALRLGVPGIDAAVGQGPLRVAVASFFHVGAGYMFCALGAAMLFGWLLERRHGWWAPPLVFLAGGAAGLAAADALTASFPLGANGAALALVGAWAVPDLIERRRGEETDSDLIGVAVITVVLLALALAAPSEASIVVGVVGGAVGLSLGGLLTATRR